LAGRTDGWDRLSTAHGQDRRPGQRGALDGRDEGTGDPPGQGSEGINLWAQHLGQNGPTPPTSAVVSRGRNHFQACFPINGHLTFANKGNIDVFLIFSKMAPQAKSLC